MDWRVAGDWTALHRAAWGGHTDVARLLVDAGWSLEARNNTRGETPFSMAAKFGKQETVKYLGKPSKKKKKSVTFFTLGGGVKIGPCYTFQKHV